MKGMVSEFVILAQKLSKIAAQNFINIFVFSSFGYTV